MATFGYTTIGTAGNDNPSNNVVWCKSPNTPAISGVVLNINIYCAQIDTSPTIVLALYSDNAGAPGNLLADGSALTPVAVGASFGWVTQDLSSLAFSVVASTPYWFAVLVPGGDEPAPPNHDVNVKFDTNGSATEGYFKSNGTPAGSRFPANGTGATGFTNERWSVYANVASPGQIGKLIEPMQNTFGLIQMQAVGRASNW